MINTRFRNSVKQTKTYPGADIGSDHNPVVATVKINLKRIKKKDNDDSMDHIHQHENTNIVSRHKPEDQITSNKMLYLAPTLFYGAETWTITKSLLSGLGAFEAWFIAEF